MPNVNQGEGTFCFAFEDPRSAIEWAIQVQIALLKVDWPQVRTSCVCHYFDDCCNRFCLEKALLKSAYGAEELADNFETVLFRGLRVRMGIHSGRPRVEKDSFSRRAHYSGMFYQFSLMRLFEQ